MRFGVYFDLRNPPGWRQDWARLYAFTLEMCEEAERLGADSAWFSEHHLFEDGYLPQPLTFAAAAAARTPADPDRHRRFDRAAAARLSIWRSKPPSSTSSATGGSTSAWGRGTGSRSSTPTAPTSATGTVSPIRS